MRPIETDSTTTTYVGGPDRPSVGDLPVEVRIELADGGRIVAVNRSRWRPTEDERTKLILGADVVLDVIGTGHPPVRVGTSDPPIEPALVYAAVDGVIGRSVAFTISSLLRDVGYDEISTDTVAGWSEDETKSVRDWLADHPSDQAEAGLEEWAARAPEVLRGEA